MTPINAASLQALFVSAVRLHQSGRLGEAEAHYRKFLALLPDNDDALHLLGVVASQSARHEMAIGLISRAIRLNDGKPPFHANLGSSLRVLGRHQDAAACYRRAIELKADYADAHHHLGTCLRDLGRITEAEACYREALRLRKDYAEAHNNLGNLLRETGRLAEAEACYRQALRLTPGHHPHLYRMLCNLGTVLRDQKRLPESEECYWRALNLRADAAEAHSHRGTALRDMEYLAEANEAFRRAVILEPAAADFYNNISTAQRQLGRVAAAETSCRRALSIAPEFADAYNNLGGVLYDLGRVEEARALMEKSLSLAPGKIPYHLSIAVTKRYGAEDPHLKAMLALLPASGSFPDEDRAYLHFALAKAYDDFGAHELSFRQLLDGNQAKRRLIHYDEQAALASFEQIKQSFTAELIGAHYHPAPADGPIFILGMLRSGSTLVEQILASHPLVFGAGELSLFKSAIGEVAGRGGFPGKIASLGSDSLARLGKLYAARLQEEAPDSARITDKFLHNFLYCGLIPMVLPQARIIHTVRDPLDTCLSIYSKLFAGRQPFAYDLGELGRYYRGYQSLMEHWRRIMPPSIMLDVRYEDVVDDLEGQARRILDHCGLPWDPACLSFYRTNRAVRTASALQVRQPIYRNSVGRWRPEPDLIRTLTEELSK